ncbi:putative DNA-binding protein with PD1-like DNA-binding motif [Collimonas fungivorans Ter331]|uniref:Putative DNA-binding protein with PD1-like DNA-binding motif n=2 Tax=Collimonas fungivorans TaxID=158899 RepID=G0A948_COLFT|nr:putative DNA-binding protein with PD1-like DNA-binding motif [Collimonas fungivorans Ter331]
MEIYTSCPIAAATRDTGRIGGHRSANIPLDFFGGYKDILDSLNAMAPMQTLPLRLNPGQDLRSALESVLAEHGVSAAFVLQGIGSLSVAQLRFAGAQQAIEFRGDLEILTLAGSLSPDGIHLHMTIADAEGRVLGGHVAPGCIVRTTVELLLALLPEHRFAREPDPASGFNELVIRQQSDPDGV